MLLAAAGFAAAAYIVWAPLDAFLGRSLIAQLITLTLALTAGSLVYVGLVSWLQIPEAAQLRRRLVGRFRPRPRPA